MKKTIRTHYRVEVTPSTWSFGRAADSDHDLMRRLLDEIERGVKRHVDGVEQVVALWDTAYECSHCGLSWEVLTAAEAANPSYQTDENSVEGEPVCCDKAIDEFRTERGIPALAETGGAA